MSLAPQTTPGIVVEGVRFSSGPYCLQAELAYPDVAGPWGAAVLAGPHPLLGGNMQNNVISALGDGLAERGLLTLRFNYRGVGHSEGPPADVARHMAAFWKTSHVPGELDLGQDVQAAAAYLTGIADPGLPLALIGYSFGCALLPQVLLDRPSPALVLLAPPVTKHNLEPFWDLASPKLVIASVDDFATDAGQLRQWFERLQTPRQLILQRFDNHFFRGHEGWLTGAIHDFLRDAWRRAA
jgi:alpha/beta superfamily hydrolase